MTVDHDTLLALARKAIGAAGAADTERLIEDLDTFVGALMVHLDQERKLLVQLPPVEAQLLGRGQTEVWDAARALLDEAKAGCNDLSGQCEARVEGLFTLLTLQTRDEQVALHDKYPKTRGVLRTTTVANSAVHRHEDQPLPTHDSSIRTLIVLENSNCTRCHNRMLSALQARARVHRVRSDFVTGCLVIEHEDDPDELVSLIASTDRAVTVAANGEKMMVSLDYHEAAECPATKGAFPTTRAHDEPRTSASKKPPQFDSAGFNRPPSSDSALVGRIASNAAFSPPMPPHFDVVEEWGAESFPASDPPQSWCSERAGSER